MRMCVCVCVCVCVANCEPLSTVSPHRASISDTLSFLHLHRYNITCASDVYSFGIMLNELETFAPPWVTELSHPSHGGGDDHDTGNWVVREVKKRTLEHERPTLCNSRLIGAVVKACWEADPVRSASSCRVCSLLSSLSILPPTFTVTTATSS